MIQFGNRILSEKPYSAQIFIGIFDLQNWSMHKYGSILEVTKPSIGNLVRSSDLKTII